MGISKRGAATFGAGALILAVAGGTVTSALWSDSATLPGATITSGNLDVNNGTAMKWYDATTDGATGSTGALAVSPVPGDTTASKYTPITLAATTAPTDTGYKVVPGDTIVGVQGIDVALDGDNLQATITLNNSATGALITTTPGVKITYTVFDKSGNPVTGLVNVPVTTTATNTTPTLKITKGQLTSNALDSADDFKVVTTAVFDSATSNQSLVNSQAVLSTTAATLTQVR